MEQDICKIFRVGIIGAPASAEKLAVVPGIDLLLVIIRLQVFHGDGNTQVLFPHLRHGCHIGANISPDAGVGEDDRWQPFRSAVLGLLEQFACLLGVIGQSLELRVESRQAGRIQTFSRQGMSTHHHIDIFLPVECHAERLADIHIVKRRARGIKGHVARAQIDAGEQLFI